MAVSKRDFEATAKVIKQERDLAFQCENGGAVITTTAIALGLAAHFGKNNPRFDRDAFLAACGLPR